MTGTFARAEQLLAAQRYGEAITFCEEQLAASPRCVTLRLLYGKALLARRQPAAAMAAFEECLRVDPSCAEARALLEGAEAARPLSFVRPSTMEALAELARPPTLDVSSEFGRPPTITASLSPLMAELRSSTIVIRGGKKRPPTPPPASTSSQSLSMQPLQTPLPTPIPATEDPATAIDVALPPPPPPSLALPKGARPALGRTGQIRQVSPPPTPGLGPMPPMPKRARRVRRLPRLAQSLALMLVAGAGISAWWYAGRRAPSSLPPAAIGQPAPRPASAPAMTPGSSAPVALAALPSSVDAPVTPEKAQLEELMGDVWIHPLLGPTRRMPLRGSRLFGAERLGDRPSECLGGHCGVDLGGKLGEPVLAVHDGIVDRVQRASNSDHGGHYVRIAHRDGNIYSQYFHLGPIPRTLLPGTPVKAGDVIGFVGMTGVKHSGPHLHFTMAIQDSAASPARYVDPEPLVALWPVRVPASSDGEAARLSAAVPAGVTRGFTQRHFRYGRVRHGSKAVDRAD